MKKLFKYLYKRTKVGHIVIQQFINLHNFYLNRVMSEKAFAKRGFRKSFNREVDLENPKTLNEKIVWLKLNDRTPVHTICSDKYAVRDYIEKRIGEEYLVPLYFQSKDPNDIAPENMPNHPFIIKTNHDSGGGIMVRDKSSIDWKQVQKGLRKRLKKNYYYSSKEWQYKNIEPRIIVEKLLLDQNGDPAKDYKMHCFNGEVIMLQVDIGRFSGNHCRNFYNKEWQRQPYRWPSPKENGKLTNPSDYDVEKPQNLQKMISLSESLAKDFSYVRIDWYDVNGKLYFGEITFHTDGGNRPILPAEWDRKLGDMLILPNHPSKN
ncbi:ATP-grasp fold amidoligase family protein [Flagellimonas allohymeniacidonis]|uniref:Glycosyl transferase n=1 Tax=Flagellimonas allohymeniacidonis TaxID=2517819 RepID=A0A4Q8QIN3_9FLAO|nr:ATP-grasp fold amidoligase family protein [Allomuricauda hymeniacidonis]TAI48573.1 glycosyl transferase [Allomuricauda hymeniacidonis]